ncbi:MAG: hypothetical protein Q8P20_06035 [bacterium]|nr:hypothetical protein [bacterium]
MKKLSCLQLGGPCDFVVEGETPKDLFTRIFMHIRETADKDHQDLFHQMSEMSDEDCEKWNALICNVCQDVVKDKEDK